LPGKDFCKNKEGNLASEDSETIFEYHVEKTNALKDWDGSPFKQLKSTKCKKNECSIVSKHNSVPCINSTCGDGRKMNQSCKYKRCKKCWEKKSDYADC